MSRTIVDFPFFIDIDLVGSWKKLPVNSKDSRQIWNIPWRPLLASTGTMKAVPFALLGVPSGLIFLAFLAVVSSSSSSDSALLAPLPFLTGVFGSGCGAAGSASALARAERRGGMPVVKFRKKLWFKGLFRRLRRQIRR